MSRAVKGLLIKDIKLIISQYKLFSSIIVAWGFVMAWGFGMSSFAVGYGGMMLTFVSLGTLNFDEAENGMPFLLTMPIVRKDYIRAKFILGISLTTLAVVLMSTISMAAGIVKGEPASLTDFIFTTEISLIAGYMILLLETPLLIKFGQGKGRVVSVVFVVCMAAVGGTLANLYEIGGGDIIELAGGIIGLGTGGIMALTAAALVLMIFLSYKISCAFMEKKEY